MDSVAETLFDYLRDVIYNPKKADLDIEKLPEEFRDFGEGLCYFVECVMETKALAQSLAKGDLTGKIPPSDNEIASPLKALHASLRHLTWQTKQVAQGDYQQRIKFMGEFATAFNAMTQQLEERQKLSDKQKSELQQYINLILSNTPDIILVFNTEGNAILANEAYKHCKKTVDVEEIKGKSYKDVFSTVADENLLRDIVEMFQNAILTGRTVQTEHTIDFAQDGNPRNYLIHVTPVLSEDKVLKGTMVVFNDMTEIIQARIEAERARELAERSTKAKSDFLARMTHEMRTPMNAIIGMTLIGKTAPDIAKKDYSFEKIEIASTHLLGVINDILDISKIEADKLELSFSKFNLDTMLNHVKSIVKFQALEKEQTFTINVDNNTPSAIISDEQRLAQILTNLLSNAVKFTPKHGQITLTLRITAETDAACTIRFSVEDTGIGISEEQQKYLFTAFEQADGSISRKFGGTGLGLAISKRIVEMLGGSIWVESALGKGAAFIFDVDVQKCEATAGDTEEEISAQKNDFTGKRILIAEDVDINREIIASLLEDTGVEICFAFDGAEAIEKFAASPSNYGLILMDIQMPGTDGYEATRRIRSSGLPRAETIPIVAMTANVLREDVERCLAAGMNDHLGKPVDIDEVVAKLGEYL
ncbi:MAG: response regulator [Oscillospiraceae bacterium]|jgi:PAS domain S-box-containing protein|nr:response regulator [Oscillospiraceae bacterium]